MNFSQILQEKINHTSPIVIGIDPNLALMAPEWLKSLDSSLRNSTVKNKARIYEKYGKIIIYAVRGLVPAIKIQMAFFEPLGYRGIKAVENLISISKKNDLLVIMDVKRGDVPSTAEQYAQAYLGEKEPLSSDAVTLNPYLGKDSLEPFIKLATKNEKGIFICLKTSNPGSKDLQNLIVENEELYINLARQLLPIEQRLENRNNFSYQLSSLGIVVGATFPKEAKKIRKVLKKSFFLIPGLGHQGGSLAEAKHYFTSANQGALFNFSRSVIYPNILNPNQLISSDELKQQIRLVLKKKINNIKNIY